ncbi:MAG: NAD-dependent protein deacylase [Hyalangium sp.]|uniref:NAD-dependent protein deacylase n=1 Tax=Hyalangium sp. TaxID=2028555 RepID=UPI00389A87F1
MELEVTRVVAALSQARSVLFITGAGISAESGLPTYRGIGGLYNDQHAEGGMPIEEVMSGPVFRRRPELTWKHLHRIENACRGASFNRAHEILALMEGCFERCWVLTQNVDGFHRAAGSKNVIDIHGDLHDLSCTRCGYKERVKDYSQLAPSPFCARCGGVIRPDVVLFEEMLPPAKTDLLQQELDRGFDVVFSIGTSSVFPYITLPVVEAASQGKATVEINPGRTSLSEVVGVRLATSAVTACEALWAARDKWRHA